MDSIRRLTQEDLPLLRNFWVEHWGGELMFMHGGEVRYDQVEGFVFGDWVGLITFFVKGDWCEITSLNSLQEDKGIATQLINEVIRESKERKCSRLSIITTNDNLRAIGFYQKRGFELATLYRGAVNETRKQKPFIPEIGQNDIPLRDEIELEYNFSLSETR